MSVLLNWQRHGLFEVRFKDKEVFNMDNPYQETESLLSSLDLI